MSEASKIEKLGWEAIIKSQPNGMLPDWLVRNATSNKRCLKDGLWELAIFLFKKRELEPDESWERRPDGSKVLVRFDPASGEKRYVLTYRVDDSARVDLFRVEIVVPSEDVSIKKAINVADLDPAMFELFYDGAID